MSLFYEGGTEKSKAAEAAEQCPVVLPPFLFARKNTPVPFHHEADYLKYPLMITEAPAFKILPLIYGRRVFVIKICRRCECHCCFGTTRRWYLGEFSYLSNKTKAKEISRGPEPM